MEKLLVSACLLGCKVRYNAGSLSLNSNEFKWLQDNLQLYSFCPEVSGGLPTPRAPAEIKKGTGRDVLIGNAKVIDQDNNDYTEAFIKGAYLALNRCQSEHIRYALLAESSPSCGSTNLYDGSFSGTKISGEGVTSALLKEHGIAVFSQHTIHLLIQHISAHSHISG